MVVKSMSRTVLIALICCVALAASAPYQELAPKPGYVPVYIREGDTPLSEIHPKLAEAFGELDMKMLKEGDSNTETKTIKKDMKEANDVHEKLDGPVEPAEPAEAGEPAEPDESFNVYVPLPGEDDDASDDGPSVPRPMHAIDAEIMLAAETVEAAPHLSEPLNADKSPEKENTKRDAESSDEAPEDVASLPAPGESNESDGFAVPSDDDNNDDDMSLSVVPPPAAAQEQHVKMLQSESDIASFDVVKGA